MSETSEQTPEATEPSRPSEPTSEPTPESPSPPTSTSRGRESTDDDADGAEREADDEEPDDEEPVRGVPLAERLEQEGDIAADYLEELLDIADLDGDLDMDVEGERAVVSIVGADLAQLVGPRGEVLEALQELTRLAVYRETGERSRLMLDISGHRAQIRRDLEELAAATAAQVKDSGEQVAAAPDATVRAQGGARRRRCRRTHL